MDYYCTCTNVDAIIGCVEAEFESADALMEYYTNVLSKTDRTSVAMMQNDDYCIIITKRSKL